MSSTVPIKHEPNASHIHITVQNQQGAKVAFQIKPTTTMKRLKASYCERQSIHIGAIRFLYSDGERVMDDDTPASKNLQDNEIIDAVMEQTGG